jgi:hypothetical protein
MLTIETAREPADISPVELDAGVGAVRSCELLPVATSVTDHVRIAEAGAQGDLFGADLIALEWDPVKDEECPISRPAPDDRPGYPDPQEPTGGHVECCPPKNRVVGV